MNSFHGWLKRLKASPRVSRLRRCCDLELVLGGKADAFEFADLSVRSEMRRIRKLEVDWRNLAQGQNAQIKCAGLVGREIAPEANHPRGAVREVVVEELPVRGEPRHIALVFDLEKQFAQAIDCSGGDRDLPAGCLRKVAGLGAWATPWGR